MSAKFGLVYPVWNDTLPPRDFLERVHGEVGLDHILVPAVAGAVRQYRLATTDAGRCFHTEGGWHYLPDQKHYASLGLKPTTAKWLNRRKLMSALREHAEDLGITFDVELRLCNVPALVHEHPHLLMRDAWDDLRPDLGACVINPEFRELLHATVADVVEQFAPRRVSLPDAWPDSCGQDPFIPSIAWSLHAVVMSSKCFCPSCRQVVSSHIDIAAAATTVRQKTESYLVNPPEDGDVEALLFDVEQDNAYCDHRRENWQTWQTSLANDFPDVEVRFFESAEETYERTARDMGFDTEIELPPLCLDATAWRPEHEDAAELVRFVSSHAREGVERFDFRNLECSHPEAITWLKQAVRFTRREAAD